MTLDQLREHIETVVGYCWEDERADYFEHCETDGPQPSHVFRHLRALAEFLYGEIDPNDYHESERTDHDQA